MTRLHHIALTAVVGVGVGIVLTAQALPQVAGITLNFID